ncbi:DNA polymerase III subunit delta' [Spirulina subsalsa]|uniref:DNA polymerase III subunit delta' n=1 Tax=Spirulina subsalsa TaxID=54311 RepID=UPI0002ECD5E0|nr:DNA polymerase III subunit delta' [Spirulina subsalsa]
MNPFLALRGQPQAVELLQQALLKDKIAPAYLFVGSPGIGRKIAALAFAQLLLAHHQPPDQQALIFKKVEAKNHPDFLWVEPTYQHQGQRLTATEAEAAGLKRKAPPQIRIEQIREISTFLARPPLNAMRAVVVIEDADTMAEGAANALLKTLEEPGRATLILIAPSGDSLLSTLVSRCQRIPFYRLPQEEMGEILRAKGYGDIADHGVLCAIAQGSPGEALLAAEQLAAIPPELLNTLATPPTTPQQALFLAKEIDQTLEAETQLWLLNYLQYTYWQKYLNNPRHLLPLETLEKARQALLSYVQPRLVWECTLLEFCSHPTQKRR